MNSLVKRMVRGDNAAVGMIKVHLAQGEHPVYVVWCITGNI